MAGRSGPFGAWKSPISPALVAGEKVWLRNVVLDGEDIYWLEARSADQGRFVIVRHSPDGKTLDVTPPQYSARNSVNEYGGGRYTVANRVIYFSNYPDDRVYRQMPGGDPEPITPQGAWRYADFSVHPQKKFLYCVREDHTLDDRWPSQSLVSIDPDSGTVQVLVCGDDFYASPRVSPDGKAITWLTWSQQDMPWDGTKLWIGELGPGGIITSPRCIAGGIDESVLQPEWSPDGQLYYVSDHSGWWNLYRWRDEKVEAVTEMAAELAAAPWHLGYNTYAFTGEGSVICAFNQGGFWQLAMVDTNTKAFQWLYIPYTELSYIRATPTKAVFIGGSARAPESVIKLELDTGQHNILRKSIGIPIDPEYFAVPERIDFPTAGECRAHAFFYPPTNPDFAGLASEKPPLLVTVHGGPTDSARTILNLDIQFWTSRGFAVVDVNYGGSTGYGRSYRQRLYANWGIVDVEDCVQAVDYLVKQNLVDPKRTAIRGHSAGGYTVLSCLAFRKVFQAGAAYYGISDLEALVRTTHKFEHSYDIRLVAPYPERLDVYRARSPLYHAEQIACPIILFQGLLDRVVPPEQSEKIVAALQKKGLPVTYIAFEDEYHGFLKAENLQRCYRAELEFYTLVLGFAQAH